MFLKAFKTSLPALFCYFPLGVVYGVLCSQQSYPWYYAPLFSTFVLAGAMQFLALSVLSAGGSLVSLAFALIPLGIRNIFYGLTMLERYRKAPLFLRLYLAHGLVDATYSLLKTGPTYEEKTDIRYITMLTSLIHFYWIAGSFFGSFALEFVTFPKGLEFSLTAFFTAAAVEHFLKEQDYKPIAIAVFAIPISVLFFPHHFFIAGVGLAILASLALPQREWKRA